MKYLLLLLVILPALNASNNDHDIKILKLQVKALMKLQTDTSLKLTQTNQKLATNNQILKQQLSQTEQKVKALVAKDQTLNGYCKIKSNQCGSCYCAQDFNIPAKFYCDCRARAARRDCKEHYLQGERTNGLYRINLNTYGIVVPVFCDQTTDGGGWTLLQRRVDGSTNFFRNWETYKEGFGQLQHEHWLGNDNLHLLTAQSVLTGSEVRFDLQVKDSTSWKYAKYSSFHIDGESNAYQLHINGHTGNAEDAMVNHNGMKWSTPD
ncbi:fibrinogen C domain-containing protein 1-like [Clytia hemisphaerica]|uniref:fibrinogen C domain-containing protein 1-like n=1 Tax=Clytia hemisphaerica TaxID=252671 RepID=UPI0034D4E6D0